MAAERTGSLVEEHLAQQVPARAGLEHYHEHCPGLMVVLGCSFGSMEYRDDESIF